MREKRLQRWRRAVGPYHSSSDYSTTGDGLVAAMQVLAVVHKLGRAGERGLPPVRTRSAGVAERSLQARPAALKPWR